MDYTRVRRRVLVGLVAGLLAALPMDAVTAAILALLWARPDLSFAIIGDTLAIVLGRIGLDVPGGVPTGVVLHYSVSVVLGALFGLLAVRIRAVRPASPLRAGVLGALFTELISLPVLSLPPILLEMSALGVAQWFGLAVFLHAIFGSVLGLLVHFGLRVQATARPGPVPSPS